MKPTTPIALLASLAHLTIALLALPNTTADTAVDTVGALGEPTSIPFLPTDFFLPGESSTRHYLPTTFTTATVKNEYAPPGGASGVFSEAGGVVVTEVEMSAVETTAAATAEAAVGGDDEGGDEEYVTAGGWADPKSEMRFPFRGGVKTKVWDN